MTTRLPPRIAAYFTAADREDLDGMLDCFAPDAVVIDEDAEWQGRAEIRRWRATVATKYQYTVQIRSVDAKGQTDRDERFDVQTHLEGNFPGGEVDLEYRFLLRDDQIGRLEIVPNNAV